MKIQVSPEDEWLLTAHKWVLDAHGYACRGERAGGKFRRILLHRLISGAPQGVIVDHIDGDRLNNRRENLRLCGNAENLRNRKTPKNNKTGYKGVSRDARRNKYQAIIKAENKKHYLGSFDTPEKAALAYNAAAIRLHGEFARLNSI
jgi:hypothetical protein